LVVVRGRRPSRACGIVLHAEDWSMSIFTSALPDVLVPGGLPSAFTVTRVTVGTAAARVVGAATPVTTTPIVKAATTNTGIVYVLSFNGAVVQGFPLAAGDVILVPVNDLFKIWLIADAAAQGAAVISGA